MSPSALSAKFDPKRSTQFRQAIYRYYRKNKRDFPWRQTTNPYHIMVSEFMLQQTQTSRVINKYQEFLKIFPDISTLAGASLRQVLQMWQGLGYNRRALALHKTAQTIVTSFYGIIPSSPEILITLPGIGTYTASAITALAFNQPVAFIETNIRTVFFHFFFPQQDNVSDRDLLPLIETTLDTANIREWYYALFDYGAMLKKKHSRAGNSAHNRKQSPFQGSNRQLRGQVVRLLLAERSMTERALISHLKQKATRMKPILCQLKDEGFIDSIDDTIRLR
jgi:A/G-specific adenine glycosylase